jgi:Anti-sigma-K factor rskA.
MSNPHISEEFPALLTGQAGREIVLTTAAHLRDCLDCQQELVSLLVAHAALSSAHRFAPELVGVLAEVAPEPGPPAPTEPPTPPDLSAVFAQVRKESSSPRPSGPLMSYRARYLLLAAAAAVAIGGGSAAIVTTTSGNSSPRASSARTIRLAPIDTGTSPATARIENGGVSIDATALPHLADQRYEVWLTNPQRTQMQPVGWIGADGRATLTVPADLMSRYSDIEVSVQQLSAANYDYSGIGVLRGAYR